MPTMDIYELLENAPKYAERAADLYNWSTNFEAGTGPFTLYLDLIGWSADEIGQPLYSLETANLGYVELGKLGRALDEYADQPQDVREFVASLMSAEMAD